MEPFQIVCPSCQGKLRVAKESLLGRTIACPRCSQPVEVIDPRRVFVRPPEGEALDSEAITRGADESLGGNAPHSKAESPASQLAGKRGFRNDPAPATATTPLSPAPTPAPQSPRGSSDDRTVDAASQVVPLELPQNWSADRLSSSRRWLQAITLGLIGLLAAGAGFLAFVRLFQNQQNREDIAAAPPRIEGPQVANDDRQRPQEKDQPNPKEPIAAAPTPDPSIFQPKVAEPPNAAAWTPPVGNSDKEKPQSSPGEDPDPVEAAPEVPGTKEPSSDLPNGVAEVDVREEPKAGDEEVILPEVFRTFLPGGGLAAGSQMSDAILSAEPAPVLPEAPQKIRLDSYVHPPAAELGDVVKQLDWTLGELEVPNMPLHDALGILSQLTGVGMQLDLPMLLRCGVSPTTPVSGKFQELKVSEAVSQLVAPLGLQLILNDGQLPLIAPSPEMIGKRLEQRWKIDDLGDIDAQQGWWKAIGEVVPELRDWCRMEDGELIWEPKAPSPAKLSLSLTLDRIRAAIGKPPQWKWADGQLERGYPWGGSTKWLQATASSASPQDRPWVHALQRAAKESDIDLVVDWKGLASHGVTPKSSGTIVLRSRTIPQIFKKYRERLALELVVVQPGLLYLTIPETRRLDSQVYLVALPAGSSPQDLVPSLRAIAPASASMESLLRVVPTPESPWCLVRTCMPSIEQLESLPQGSGS
ncbi:MAG: hypothetical protein ACKN94_00805 [Pirellulaceae bacterium]